MIIIPKKTCFLCLLKVIKIIYKNNFQLYIFFINKQFDIYFNLLFLIKKKILFSDGKNLVFFFGGEF